MQRCRLLLVVAAAAAACARAPEPKQYELRGQVLGVQPERNEVLIKHEDIKGFMPGMTMPFKVKEAALLTGKQPGDLVTATLVVGDVDAYLSAITRTGHAPLEGAPAADDTSPMLAPGEPVADAPLVDQSGQALPFSTLKGHRVALTFIYTRCPLVEFCPRMVYHFRTLQQLVKSAPDLADVRLLTVTLDPEFDTPAVLAPYAERAGADPARWSFVTGEPAAVAQFASQFGLYVERNPDNAIDITHNLVTALVDAGGRLVTLHTGNDWTPKQLVADLSAIPAPAN
jgi:protein SCO1/2